MLALKETNADAHAWMVNNADKPIITILEKIRRLCMERIKDRKLAIGTKLGPLCPRINKIIDKVFHYVDSLDYVWNGTDEFEVYCVYKWRSIPLHDVVSDCYKVSTFGWIYDNVLQPMSGPSEWPKTNRITLLPPKYVRQPGRPKLSHNVRTCPKKKAEVKGGTDTAEELQRRMQDHHKLGQPPMQDHHILGQPPMQDYHKLCQPPPPPLLLERMK
ncbi:hypothetical protein LIER_24565 [Lithospermum erythrorhizon]|uniref:Uncharacterized protein n=1 Tax=Lithospermum erythrorhizon TaxID=34254 RepID=A0AAV3R315_LITER